MKKILSILVMGMISCNDYLDISPKDQVSDTYIWESSDQADLFLNNIYASLPSVVNRFDPWENWSDDSMDGAEGTNSRNIYAISAYTPANAETQWGQYSNIRKCNLFIEKITDSDLPDEWKTLRLAEARFLRAYYYMLLWTWHGGVPIITDVLNYAEQGDEIFRERNSSDETFKFITDECSAILNDLPLVAKQKGRITKGMALTLKGFCELFNASPLHNPTNDKAKWALAAATNKVVINLNVYKLFPDYETLFFEENNYNDETILCRPHIGGTSIGRSTEGYAGSWYTGGAQTSYAMINPTQEIVDQYVMSNGLPITDPDSGYDPQNPYLNREKRFYQSIIYDGSVWNGVIMYSRMGAESFNEIDLSPSTGATNTGYYMRKGLKEEYAVAGENQLSSANSILFRYAEVMLSYAEAQNEAVGPDNSVYEAVNKIRARAELPPLKEGLSQNEMREAIWRERRVELAFEERRWFDLIRLKIAEEKLNGTLHAMKIEKNNNILVYKVISASGGRRVFNANRDYYLPIPQTAIDRNPKLTQNPNYN
ncbi:MAG: RagB/SusD family nutrient uptake outer membrane protein [Mangrovibacterium sp.]